MATKKPFDSDADDEAVDQVEGHVFKKPFDGEASATGEVGLKLPKP